MRTSKVQKQWFAERYGELHVKDIKNHISIVIEEALERHNMQPTSQNRQDIYDAYKTANPRTSQYAKDTYDVFYERGAAKFTEENRTILDYLAIDRELSVKAVRDEIVTAYKTGKNCAIDPKHLDIFDKGVTLNDLQQTRIRNRDKNRPTESDGDCFEDESLESFEMDNSETETDEMS